MRLVRPLRFALAVLALAACTLGAWGVVGAQRLDVVRRVANNVLTSTDPALQIRVNASFQYVGSTRFILRGVADAEQHLFVDADAKNVIRTLYWIQFEQYLPGRGGKYNYDSDAAQSAWGVSWRTNVRRFTQPPAAGSDQDSVHQLLAQHGFRVSLPSVRARLIYLPTPERREEVMIIYSEPAGDVEPTATEREQLIARAMAGLTITPYGSK